MQAGPQPDDRPVVRLVQTRQSASARSRRVNVDAHSFVEGVRRGARPRSRLGLPDDRLRAMFDRVAGQRHPRDRELADATSARRCSARATAATARTTSTSTSATRSRRAARRSTSASATTGSGAARCRARSRPTRRSRRSCPGLTFAGYDSPFTWNNVLAARRPTYALDEHRRTIARATYSRYAGQLSPTTIGGTEPGVDGRLGDLPLGRHQRRSLRAGRRSADRTSASTQGGGFNPANPTAVTSANQIDPNLKAPLTHSFVAGVDRELMAEPRGAGELQLHADDRPVRQLHGEHHAARRRHAGRLHAPGRC